MSSAQGLLKTNYRKLYRELLEQNKRLYELRAKDELKKRDVLLKYRRINLIKSGKSVSEADELISARKEQILEQQRQQDKKRMFINSLGLSADYKTLLDENTSKKIKTLKPDASTEEAQLEEQLHKANVLYVVENFLRSQRKYQELLERYNPGMTMTQEDKVRKTAQKVGLDVPEN